MGKPETPPEMRSLKVILFALLCIQLTHAQSYECTIKKDGEQEFCVFQNVRFFKNTTNISFSFPGTTKPTNIAFEDSHMVGIPGKFLDVFEDNLKMLKVEGCKLRSVTITRNMEALYAGNNLIDKVLTDGCGSLIELDLSSNRLNTVNNITNCAQLKKLNLSGNERVWSKNTVDFSDFRRLTHLETLDLSNTGIFYLDNLQNAQMESLKLLDLSKNDILPSDLRLEVFNPFGALETLKLNDNNMEQLDYAELKDIKSLKTVYLNGNNFLCIKMKDMIEFLNKQHNIETPLERQGNCADREFEGMCCKGPLPTQPPRPTLPTTPHSRDTTPSRTTTPYATGETTTTLPADAESDSSWQIVLAVVAIIGIVSAGVGFIIYKKRSSRVQLPQ